MMTARSRVVLIGAVLLGTACSSFHVKPDAAPGTDFARYSTFALVPAPADAAIGKQLADPQTRARIDAALTRGLEAKGLRRAGAADADLLVWYAGTAQDATSPDIEYWGTGGPAAFQTPMVDKQPDYRGELAVQVDDARSKQRVWRGVSTGEARVTLDAAAAEIVKAFPPAR